MHVAPREIVTVVERVLLRREFPPGAARPAAELVLAAIDAGVDGLGLLRGELHELEPGQSADIAVRGAGVVELDAGGASTLLVGPGVLDLLDSADAVVARGVRSASLLALLPGGGRERGIALRLSIRSGAARVERIGRCEPSTPRLRASLAVDETVWSDLNSYANRVLAPASAESRADAGY